MNTIDEIIAELEKMKTIYGGKAEIAIKDADTGVHMKISSISESSTTEGRVLVRGMGYDNCDILEKTN